MGVFTVPLQIGDPGGARYHEVSALVDTGSTYTTLPASLLRELGVSPTERRPFLQADGRRVRHECAWMGGPGRPSLSLARRQSRRF